jgi:AcrR family transcriptional regulator
MVAPPSNVSPAGKKVEKRQSTQGRPVSKRVPSSKAPPDKLPESTRERILHAAIAEFSEKGYSGARVDTICKASRANPRMIYHYFGGKDHLYIAVLEHVLGELRSEELKLDVAHVAPLDGMMQLFDFTYEHFGKHPELIHLLSGENLLRARFLRRSVKTPIIASPLIKLIDQLLRRGERAGDFRRGIDALHLYVILVGFSYFHRSNAHTLSVIFQSELLARPWQAEHKRYAKEMVSRFLRRDGIALR